MLQLRRRAFLSAIPVTAVVAGCIGTDSGDAINNEPGDTHPSTTTRTPARTGTKSQSEPPTETDTITNSETESQTRTATETPTETVTESPTNTATSTPEPPDQPKIREVQNNLGHTFKFTDDDFPGSPVTRAEVEDEVVVKDGMELELCVTEVAKKPGDTVTYSFRHGNSQSDHPDNPRATDRIKANCWSWIMRREDYSSRWHFRIWVRNEDEIYYQNDSPESDYMVDVDYTNLTLEDS